LNDIQQKQFKTTGEIAVGDDKRLSLQYTPNSRGEMVTDTSNGLIRRFSFAPDTAQIENAEPGTRFPVLIDLTREGRIRQMIIQEPPKNESRMKDKFRHVCVKKLLYGRTDNPDRIILVVNGDFSKLITVNRPGLSTSKFQIPEDWKEAIALTHQQEQSSNAEEGIVFVPTAMGRKLRVAKNAITERTHTFIEIEENQPSPSLCKVSVFYFDPNVSSLGGGVLKFSSVAEERGDHILRVSEALTEVKRVTEFSDYEQKLRQVEEKREKKAAAAASRRATTEAVDPNTGKKPSSNIVAVDVLAEGRPQNDKIRGPGEKNKKKAGNPAAPKHKHGGGHGGGGKNSSGGSGGSGGGARPKSGQKSANRAMSELMKG
jgi:hypothetical protein